MSIDLPPVLRIQETVVRRHASTIAVVAERLSQWRIPGALLQETEIDGVRAALVFALALIAIREDEVKA